MHSSVLTNKKYIPFADENTVEVLIMDRLQEAVDKKERNAGTYQGKRGDETVELMIEFPNLTVKEMLDLHMSPGGQYNDTGKIPYLSIVDPHTLEQKKFWLGSVSSGDIMEAVLALRKTLNAEHGVPISRRDWNALKEAEAGTVKQSEAGEFAAAIALVTPLAKKSEKWPEDFKKRLETARAGVVTAAEAALAEVEKSAEADREAGKKALGKLLPKLKGTGLEAKAQELQKSLKE